MIFKRLPEEVTIAIVTARSLPVLPGGWRLPMEATTAGRVPLPDLSIPMLFFASVLYSQTGQQTRKDAGGEEFLKTSQHFGLLETLFRDPRWCPETQVSESPQANPPISNDLAPKGVD